MNKMTIYEIAKKAKVSIATVSRVQNPETRKKVSSATLKRVQSVIDRYNYVPNFAAKGLTQTLFHTIGVVVPHGEGFFLNEYYARILCGVADSLLDSRYRFKLLMLKCTDRKWDHYNFQRAEGVDALMITHWRTLFEKQTTFKKLGIPCMMVGDPEENLHAHFVSADQKMGGQLAAEHLYKQGHRKVAVMAGGPYSVDSKLRLEGFQSFFKQKGIVIEKKNILCGEFQKEIAKEAAKKFFSRKQKITAMFCLNDTMAYGVMEVMKKHQLSCSKDISIVGFDDDPQAKDHKPALTTLRVPLYEIAREATKRLTRQLVSPEDCAYFGRQTLFPVELIRRDSVRKM